MNTRFICLAIVLILCVSCVPVVPIQYVYNPDKSDSIHVYYLDGVPAAVTERQNDIVLMSFDRVSLNNEYFLRMWLFFFNKRSEPVLFDPLGSISLRFGYRGAFNAETPAVRAMSPSVLLGSMEQQKLKDIGADRFMTALYALSGYGSAVSKGADPMDASRTVTATIAQGNALLGSKAALYNAAKETVSAGLLRKNTVFPGKGVQGYVYFRISYSKPDFRIEMNPDGGEPLFVPFRAVKAE